MAQGSDQGRTQIIIAAIGVVGVISAAMIGNWDKMFPRETAPAAATTGAVSSGRADMGPLGAPPVDAAQNLSDAQSRALNASTGALDDIASKIEAAGTADIAGTWRDDEGFTYAFRQDGPVYSYVQLRSGARVGSGEGKMDGRDLTHRFSAPGTSGTCTGRIAAGDREITGSCNDGGKLSWPFRIVR